MPNYHNNIFCITPAKLASCGIVSTGYINRALTAQRRGEVYCWEHHKQGKQVYLHYDSLKDKYKAAIQAVLCGGVEPKLWRKHKDQQEQEQCTESLIYSVIQGVTSDAEELKILAESKLYTSTEVHQLARAAAWLRLFNEYGTKEARKLGFVSVKDFRTELFKYCLNEQDKALIRFKKGAINSLEWLARNARLYKKEGIQSLIHKGVGNINREKTDKQMHAKLISLRANPVKYSHEDIAMMYNDWALAMDKEQLSVSTIKEYLNRPKIKKAWYYKRHGQHAADNEFQQHINRQKPSFPDALWSLDGTTMQLYYLDDDGKIKSDLYVYFVTDANSTAIIGHSIAFAETSEMVEAALRNCVELHKNKPYQVQYDNSSANVSHAAQNLIGNMSRVHFPCEPHKGRSKYVETIIGHFQQRVLRHYDFFKGGNITARSLDSKANPELLAELKKDTSRLPSRSEVIEIFNDAVNKWNERGEKRDKYGRFTGRTKLQRYGEAHEKRVKLNYFDRISLFMVEQRTPYRYGNAGIEIEVYGKLKKFIVPDQGEEAVSDFAFAHENLGKKFYVKIDRSRPFIIALYDKQGKDGKHIANAYEKEYQASCVADMKKGEKASIVKLQKMQKEWGEDYAERVLKEQQKILKLCEPELRATGTDGFSWQDRSKYANNKIEGSQEDVLNGMEEKNITERQRAILNIGK